jgi:hypothetical protein
MSRNMRRTRSRPSSFHLKVSNCGVVRGVRAQSTAYLKSTLESFMV